MTEEVRVRTAPSPTGDPHVGSAANFLFNYVFARSRGGKFVLRIEDTDRARSKAEYEQAIFEAIHWLGLDPDESPEVGGPYAPYRQSERREIYEEHARQLIQSGNAYYCFCPPERLRTLRERQEREKLALRYDGLCASLEAEEVERRVAAGEKHVVRLKVPAAGETAFEDLLRGKVVFDNSEIDHQVLLKSDAYPTYHLANVVDDHLMKITHVIRAEEWISSTPKHVLLYRAFGWKPPKFLHLSLLRNKDLSKMSKRENPTSILWYRDAGFLPEALINFIALMGCSMPEDREIFSLEEFARKFSLDRLNTTAPVFDMQKLEWMNGEYIRALDHEELARHIREFAPAARELDDERMTKLIPIVIERLKTLADFEPLCAFLWTEVTPDPKLLVQKKQTKEECIEVLEGLMEVLTPIARWSAAEMEEAVREFTEGSDRKVRHVFMPLRAAVTGKTATPPLFECMELVGRERSLARIKAAVEALKKAG